MNFEEAREYITGLQKSGIKLGLERMQGLMHSLNDPQDHLKFIHIAGTNGKGSTCTFICAQLFANGYRVGMYTSPAVEDVREQYTVNGEWISEDEYAVCATLLHDAANEDLMPTSYEFETAMAFLYFYRNKCDYVVLETGMGGRDDATNIVKTTVLSVLTSISEDHLGMIGDNIQRIAQTKAGIIKEGVPVVMMENTPEVEKIIRDECRIKGSAMHILDRSLIFTHGCEMIYGEYICEFDYKEHRNVRLLLPGSYQKDNAALALEAVDLLSEKYGMTMIDNIRSEEAIENVRIPYRMEKINNDPLLYVDGAHNPDAAKRLRETIEDMFADHRLIFIMGMFRDKDYSEVIRIMAPLAQCIFTVQTPDSLRALPAKDLKDSIVKLFPEFNDGKGRCGKDDKAVVCAEDIKEAVTLSMAKADELSLMGNKTAVIAFGSLSYLKYVKSYVKASAVI